MILIPVKIPAPIITGIDNRKENLAAAGADKPIKIAMQIVAPDLEIPGIIAIAWANPITNPMKSVNSTFRLLMNFDVINMIPVKTNDNETNLILSNNNEI